MNTGSESGRMVDVGLNACCAGTTGDDERQVCCIAQEGRVVSAREAGRAEACNTGILRAACGLRDKYWRRTGLVQRFGSC